MSARPGTRHGPLSGWLVSPLRVKHEPWKPANWEHLEGAEVRNGIPVTKPYVRRDDSAREAEVAAIVAEAKRRAQDKQDN